MRPKEYFEERSPVVKYVNLYGWEKSAVDLQIKEDVLKKKYIEAMGDFDFEVFAQEELWIEVKAAIQRFKLNTAQKILDNEIERQITDKRPVRLIHLKPRQYGATTYFTGRIYRELKRKKNQHSTTISYSLTSAEHIRSMADRYTKWDKFNPPKIKNKGGKVWNIESTDSTWMIETAENLHAGHSFTNNILHASEISRWQGDASVIMRGLTSTIPVDPDTMIIIESTANGYGDYFCSLWDEAKNGNSTYIPIFISWLQIEKYFLPFENNRSLFGQSRLEFENSLDEEERGLIEDHKATMEQLHWRRWKIKELNEENKGSGGLDGFHEQFPTTDIEAFLSSGRPYFPITIVRNEYEKAKKNEIKRGNLVWKDYENEVEFEEDPAGYWRVAEEPHEGFENRYVSGADPAEGKSVTDDNKNPDYSECYVYDRYFKKAVAMFKARVDTDVFEDEIYKAYVWYKQCLCCPEKNNNAGGAIIKGLKDKINLYIKEVEGKTVDGETKEYGYLTSPGVTGTREMLLSQLRKAIKLNYDKKAKFEIPFEQFWDEAGTFIIDKTGKPIHQQGAHDDGIFAVGLMLEGASQAAEVFPIVEENIIRARTFDESPLRDDNESDKLVYVNY